MFIQLTYKEAELMRFLLDNKNNIVQDSDIDFASIGTLILTLELIKNSEVHLNDELYAALFELTDTECFDIHDAIASYTIHRKASRLTITTATDINIESLRAAFVRNKSCLLNHSSMVGKSSNHRPYTCLVGNGDKV